MLIKLCVYLILLILFFITIILHDICEGPGHIDSYMLDGIFQKDDNDDVDEVLL